MTAKNKTRNVKFGLNIFTVIPMIFLALILIFLLQGGITGFIVLDENSSNLTDDSSLTYITNETLNQDLNLEILDQTLELNETVIEVGLDSNIAETILETQAIEKQKHKTRLLVQDSKGKTVPALITIKDKDNNILKQTTGISYDNLTEGLYNIDVELQNKHVKKIEFKDVNISQEIDELVKVEDVQPFGRYKKVYSIDPTASEFTEATVTVPATGTELYKCKDWNFETQICYGAWELFKTDLVPGQDYTFTLTTDDPGFAEVIEISTASHLDENRILISNIYDSVKEQDNVWSETIPNFHYVRITFQKNLTSDKDITLYPKTILGYPIIEVYEKDSNILVAEFTNLQDNQYNTVYLTNLLGEQDTFDLQVVNGDVQFDHIIDPSYVIRPTTAAGTKTITNPANAYDNNPATAATGDLNDNGKYYDWYGFNNALTGTITSVNVTFDIAVTGAVDDRWALQYSDNAGTNWYNLRASATGSQTRTNLTYAVTEQTAGQDGVWTFAEIQSDLRVRWLNEKISGPDGATLSIYEIWATAITVPPLNITMPPNQTIEIATETTLEWNLTGAGGYYYIERNGTLVDGPKPWSTPDDLIIYEPNTYFLGTWNYTLLYNQTGSSTLYKSTVFLNVIDNTTPSCSELEDNSGVTAVTVSPDGDLTDWQAVLSNPLNFVTDLTALTGDADSVDTADRDMTKFAYTYDDEYLYFYFGRLASGSNQIAMIVYLDYDRDGYMNASDDVLSYVWSGSNQLYSSYLNDYVPSVSPGDQMFGDGYDMPGSISNPRSLESKILGGSESGIELETRVPWSALGLSGITPINFKGAAARGSGTNLPDQLTDNIGELLTPTSTAFLFRPNHEKATTNGTIVYYAHDIMNCGNVPSTIELSNLSSQGWDVTFYYPYASQTPILDTNSNGIPDISLGLNEYTTLIVKITVPSSATIGTIDVTNITGQSSSTNKSVTDTTSINDVAILPKAYVVSAAQNMNLSVNFTIYNYQSIADRLNIFRSSSNAWNTYVYYNGTLLTDTNADGFIDTGLMEPLQYKTVELRIEVPAAALIDTLDSTQIQINSSANPTKYDTSYVNSTVYDRIILTPAGYNQTVTTGSRYYYEFNITNNWYLGDYINLYYEDALGWEKTFLDKNYVALDDSNSDGFVDLHLAELGDQEKIFLKITVPNNASMGLDEITTIYANSSLNPTVYKTAALNNTPRGVALYSDSGRTALENIFPIYSTVYARAFYLQGISQVYFAWFDGINYARISQNITVDGSGNADDEILTNSTTYPGVWTIFVLKSTDDSEIARRTFNLTDDIYPNATLISPQPGTIYAFNTTTELAVYASDDILLSDLVEAEIVDPNGNITYVYLDNDAFDRYNASFVVPEIEGQYNVTFYVRDTYGNLNDSVTTYFIGSVNAPPSITINSPPNNAVDVNGNLTFNITSIDDVELLKIELYLNDTLNQTVFINGTYNETLFEINDLEDGNYNWTVILYDSMNYNQSITRYILVNTTAAAVINTTTFTGNTTDWNNVPDITNVCDGIAILDSTDDRIKWFDCVDASNVNFDVDVNLTYNLVEIQFGLDTSFNATAEITMRGLPWDDTPLIYVDDVICNNTCSEVVWINETGTAIFNVSHFSNYTTVGNSRLGIWDDTDEDHNNLTKYPNDLVTFYANYTYKNNGNPIVTGTCTITFDDLINQVMIYNATSLFFEYNRTFATAGLRNYNVTCSGAQTITLSDDVYITPGDELAPEVNLNFPNHSYNTSSTSINFNWSAIDDTDTTLVCNLTVDSVIEGLSIDSSNNTLTNYTVANLADALHFWNVTCMDDSGNYNSSETRVFQVDSTAPQYSSNLTYPISPATYAPNQNYQFNITWTDTGTGIDDVIFDFNGTNYTFSSAQVSQNGNEYYITQTDLVPGDYSFTWYANDTLGNENQTQILTYTINRATSAVNLSLNNLEDNVTIEYGDSVDILANTITPVNGYIELYNNGTLINGGLAPLQNTTQFNGLGIYNITVIYPDSQNYTASRATYYVNVTDQTSPSVTLNYPIDYYNSSSTSVLFNWTAANGLDPVLDCNLTINDLVNVSNYASQSGLPTTVTVSDFADGFYFWNISCMDDSGNYNTSETRQFTVDTSPPLWFNNTTYPLDTATYVPGQNYQFNVTWTHAIDTIDTITIEHNFTGILQNFTVSTMVGDEYYYDYSDLAAGVYVWRMYANDSQGHQNVTDQWTYTVYQATSEVNLTLNNLDANVTVAQFSSVLLNASLVTPTLGYIELYNNGTLINSGQSPLNNTTQFNIEGMYNITALYPETQNYTSSYETHYLNISAVDNEAPQWSNNLTYPVSPATYAPGQTYQFNITWIDGFAIDEVTFDFNGTNYTFSSAQVSQNGNEYYITFTDLVPGDYLFTWYANDTSSNENQTQTLTYTILKAQSQVNLTLNNLEDNITIGYGDTVDILANTISPANRYIELYNNGTLINSGNAPLQNTTQFNQLGLFNITVIYLETDNYTTSRATYYVTVEDKTAPTVTLNAPDNSYNTSSTSILFNWTASNGISTSLDCNLTIDGIVNVSNHPSPNATPTNYTVTDFQDGLHYWNVTCTDDSGNYNTSETRVFRVDSTAPQWSNNLTHPLNVATYSPGASYQFNVTWTDLGIGIDTVTIEHNFTEILDNATITTLVGNEYYYDHSDLAAGVYVWREYSNDSLGNENITDEWTYTVYQASSSVNLSLNNLEDNVTIEYGASVDILANIITPTTGYIELYINGTLINSGNAPLQNTTQFNELGLFNITVIYLETQNYTTSRATYYVTVQDTTKPSVTLNAPAHSYNTTSSSILFNWTATNGGDPILDCNLTIDGSIEASNVQSPAGVPTNVTISNIVDGLHYWNVTCNDDSGNYNTSETRVFRVDSTAPTVNLNFPAQSYNTSSTDIDFNWTALDTVDTSLDCNLTIDGTVNISNYPSQNATPTNYTVLNFQDGLHYWNVSCADDLNNENTSETRVFRIDTTAPQYSNNLTYPISPATYAPNQNYQFNITWTDTGTGIDDVVFDFNGTNYTFSSAQISKNGNEYYITFTDLVPGDYSFTWYSNDTLGNENQTLTSTYTINKAASSVNLLLNGTDGNYYILENNTVNITAYLVAPTTGYIELFNNGTLINAGQSPLENITLFNESGQYNITVIHYATQNYTESRETHYVYVAMGDMPPAVTLNAPENNAVTNLASIGFNCTATDDYNVTNITFYWNYSSTFTDDEFQEFGQAEAEAIFTKPVTQSTEIIWNCLAYDNISQSAVADTNYTLTIDLDNPTYNNLAEYPSDPATYSPGQIYYFNISAFDNFNVDSVILEFNGVNYTPSQTGNEFEATLTDLAVGVYNYVWYINDSAGNYNVTPVQTYTVNQNTSTCSLSFQPSSPASYADLGVIASCSCTNAETTGNLYLNSQLANSENNVNTTLAADTYTYVCNVTSTHNYTSASNTSSYIINRAASSVNLLLNGTDENYTVEINDHVNITGELVTGQGDIYLYEDLALINSGTSPLTNTTSYSSTGQHNITVDYPQTQNYTASDETHYIIVQDTKAPQWSNNRTAPETNAVYSQGASYQFNVTWTDEAAISNVFIEHNFSSTLSNVSITTVSGNEYYYSFNDLAAGTYYWLETANDTNGNFNTTDTFLFTVDQATPLLTLTSSPSWSETYGTQTTVNCTANTAQVTPQLYLNGTLIANPHIITLGAGNWNYTCNVTTTQNYTAAQTSNEMTIAKAASSVNLLLNSTDSNFNIEVGENVNITGYMVTPAQGYIELYNNGTLINAGNDYLENDTTFLDLGSYNITVFFYGNDNYSASRETHFVNVQPDSTKPVIGTTIAYPPAVNPGQTINFTVNVTDNVNVSTVMLEINGINYTMEKDGGDLYFFDNLNTTMPYGTYNFTVYANDTYGNEATPQIGTFTINNQPPVLSHIGNLIAYATYPFTYTATASDPNNDTLTFSDNTALFNINSATGEISFTPTTGQVGTYSVIITVSDGALTDQETITFTVRPDSNVSTQYTTYSPNTTVTELGTSFTQNGLVEFIVYNSSNQIEYGPVNYSTDLNGNFTATWPHTLTSEDNYTLQTLDLNNSFLSKNLTIEILQPYTWSGKVFNPNLTAEPSSVILYDSSFNIIATDDEVYALSLNYGEQYILKITPASGAITEIQFDFIANQGPLGDVLGIDDTPESNSTFKSFNQIIGYLPVPDNYDNLQINISHTAGNNIRVYKCSDWNFTGQFCNNDISWTQISYDYNTGTDIGLTLSPGDPGIGIEQVTTTVTPTTAGGGGGARCTSNWQCSIWSMCSEDGTQTRTCYDENYCTRPTDVPKELQSCIYITPREPEVQPEVTPLPRLIETIYSYSLQSGETAPITIRDNLGSLVEGAELIVLTPSDKKYNVFTDADGQVNIRFDEAGLWRFAVNKGGYVSRLFDIVVIEEEMPLPVIRTIGDLIATLIIAFLILWFILCVIIRKWFLLFLRKKKHEKEDQHKLYREHITRIRKHQAVYDYHKIKAKKVWNKHWTWFICLFTDYCKKRKAKHLKENREINKELAAINNNLKQARTSQKQGYTRKINKFESALSLFFKQVRTYLNTFVSQFEKKPIRRYKHPIVTEKDKVYAGLEIRKAIILRARELKNLNVSKIDSLFILTKKGYPKDLVKKGLDLVYTQKQTKHYKLEKKDILFEVKK